MVPQSLLRHDGGNPVCQWCHDIGTDYAACRAAYFVDFWQGVLGVAAIRRCEWHGEGGACRAFLSSVQCGSRSAPPPPYPPLFSDSFSGAAPLPSVLLLRYTDGSGATISAAQTSPPSPATLLNKLELRAYRGGQIVANASFTAAHGIKTASGVLSSSVVPMLASTIVGEVEHVLQRGAAGELAAQTQNASLLLFAVPLLSCCCCIALCCLLRRYRRIRVAEDDELESALGTPPEDGRSARSGHRKKLGRNVGRDANHRYEFH